MSDLLSHPTVGEIRKLEFAGIGPKTEGNYDV